MPDRFGRVLRAHRQLDIGGALVSVWGSVFIVLFAGVVTSYLADRTRWLPGILFGFGCLAAVVCVRPIWRSATRRERYLVAEQGVLVWDPKSGQVVHAIAWSAVRRVVRDQVRWTGEDGAEQVLRIPFYTTAATDLFRAFERRAPVPVRTRRRILVPLIAAVTVLLCCGPPVWFGAVPTVVQIVRGERPDGIYDLQRLCDGGRPFRAGPPYRGAGPHPIAVFSGKAQVHVVGGAGPEPEQLVACGRVTGRVRPDANAVCNYGNRSVAWYQGRWAYDVREVRTGRHVASFTLDGGAGPSSCEESWWFEKDGPDTLEFDTSPPEHEIDAALTTLLTGTV